MVEEVLVVLQARHQCTKLSFFTTYSAPWWLDYEARKTCAYKSWWSL